RKKPPVPQAGSAMVFPGSGCTHSTMAWISAAGGEVLAGAALGVFGVLLQQTLVHIALDVDLEAEPVLRVDHLHQARELGRVVDLVLHLEEDRAEHAGLLAQLL
ncbi:hypothetical protein CATMIT_01984, partial [Catenibacterium mitsuokai DSM 15897]